MASAVLRDVLTTWNKGGDTMKGVLITYKGSSRTRIVSRPSLIKAAAIACSKKRRQQPVKPVVIRGTMHKAPMTGGPTNTWNWFYKESDIRCWKRRSKKARRGWMRHPNKTCSKPKGQGSRRYSQHYYPSVRTLNERGLCIYPEISS